MARKADSAFPLHHPSIHPSSSFCSMLHSFTINSPPAFHSVFIHRFDVGRGTLTFDEFCRVAVHFSDEDDEALQLSISSSLSRDYLWIHMQVQY